MLQIARAFIDGLFLRCPRCHIGRMFGRGFQMNTVCPICDLEFEKAAGEITGGMGVNTIVTCVLIAACAIGFVLLPDVPTALSIGALIFFGSVFPIVFYRSSRGLWASFLYVTGGTTETD